MTGSAIITTSTVDMIDLRAPYWLSADERAALKDAVLTLFETATVFPTIRAHLDEVLVELGVAEARDQVWPAKTEMMRLARGYPSDVLPIRMSEAELAAVLALPNLPSALHARLGQAH